MGRDTPSLMPTQVGAMGVLNMAGEVTGADVKDPEEPQQGWTSAAAAAAAAAAIPAAAAAVAAPLRSG